MREVEITWNLAIKLWWAQTWRSVPLAILFSVVASFAFLIIAGMIGVDPTVKAIMNMGLGFVVGLIAYLWVIKRLLIKGFGRYRLAVIEKADHA